MAFDSFIVTFDGDEIEDLYGDLTSLDVELSDEYPASFHMVVGLPKEPDGSWKYLDDEKLRVWKPVTVSAGFVESGREDIFSGYITEVNPVFEADEAACKLEISGVDGTILMDRDEKLKDWPNKKDSDIATEIISSYGFSYRVEDTTITHGEELSTVIQRETDYQFLKRLALRNGLDCYIEGEQVFFAPVPGEDPPQPVLAVHFGEETNVTSFSLKVDALQPANVSMFQVDRFNKEVLSAAVNEATTNPLGELDMPGLLGGNVLPATVVVAKNAATGLPEMNALCQGLYHDGGWFIEAEGEIDASVYEHVLKPRGLVAIKGIGESHSGTYYVSYVKHQFTCDCYTQHFKVKRNGLLPTGDEEFGGDGGLLPV